MPLTRELADLFDARPIDVREEKSTTDHANDAEPDQ